MQHHDRQAREQANLMARLMGDWRALAPERRLAGSAAVALFVTMLLPWYQQNAVVNAPRTSPLQSRNLSAFGVFSFVEAAVLLVAVAVVYLLYARSEGHEFHLPGSDGAIVMIAGLWTALLLVFRLFDKPGISHHGIAANVGVQWGIFFALAAAGLMAYAGSRMRAAGHPEPPLARSDVHLEPPPARSDVEPEARDRPRYPPSPSASRARGDASPDTSPAPAPPPRPAGRSPIGRRQVAAVKATDQLSFEDQPPESD